jgi:hypothetical protein
MPQNAVTDGFQKTSMVKPVDPFQSCELDGLKRSPRSPSIDHLGFVKTVDGFSQGVVVAVADASHRRLDASFGQALGVFDRYVLAAPVAVMHEAATMDGPPIVQRLLQGIEDETRVRRATGTPSHDAAGEGVDDKRHINKALPSGHVGEVGDPQHVRPGGLELPLDVVQRARRGLVADGRLDRLAPNHPA